VTVLELKVVVRNASLDAALLRCRSDCPSFVSIRRLAELITAHMALCSFQVALEADLGADFEGTSSSLGVFRASRLSKLSAHKTHALYQSLSWPGNSGASLLLHDGLLVGIHLALVNDLELTFDQEQSLEDNVDGLASSVRQLVAGTSHGCVALLAHAFPEPPGDSLGKLVTVGFKKPQKCWSRAFSERSCCVFTRRTLMRSTATCCAQARRRRRLRFCCRDADNHRTYTGRIKPHIFRMALRNFLGLEPVPGLLALMVEEQPSRGAARCSGRACTRLSWMNGQRHSTLSAAATAAGGSVSRMASPGLWQCATTTSA